MPPDLKRIPVTTLRETALRKRPDVLAALADYAAAQSSLQLEIANQYPNIQANPGYTWEMGEHRWLLGATGLSMPIFPVENIPKVMRVKNNSLLPG